MAPVQSTSNKRHQADMKKQQRPSHSSKKLNFTQTIRKETHGDAGGLGQPEIIVDIISPHANSKIINPAYKYKRMPDRINLRDGPYRVRRDKVSTFTQKFEAAVSKNTDVSTNVKERGSLASHKVGAFGKKDGAITSEKVELGTPKTVDLNTASAYSQTSVNITPSKKVSPAFKKMVDAVAHGKAAVRTIKPRHSTGKKATPNMIASSIKPQVSVNTKVAPNLAVPTMKVEALANKKVTPKVASPPHQTYTDLTASDEDGSESEDDAQAIATSKAKVGNFQDIATPTRTGAGSENKLKADPYAAPTVEFVSTPKVATLAREIQYVAKKRIKATHNKPKVTPKTTLNANTPTATKVTSSAEFSDKKSKVALITSLNPRISSDTRSQVLPPTRRVLFEVPGTDDDTSDSGESSRDSDSEDDEDQEGKITPSKNLNATIQGDCFPPPTLTYEERAEKVFRSESDIDVETSSLMSKDAKSEVQSLRMPVTSYNDIEMASSSSESDDGDEIDTTPPKDAKAQVSTFRSPLIFHKDAETASSSNNSYSSDQSESDRESESASESDGEAPPAKKTKLAHNFSQHPRIEEMSSDSESNDEADLVKKARFGQNIGQNPRIEELDTSSESGSGSDDSENQGCTSSKTKAQIVQSSINAASRSGSNNNFYGHRNFEIAILDPQNTPASRFQSLQEDNETRSLPCTNYIPFYEGAHKGHYGLSTSRSQANQQPTFSDLAKDKSENSEVFIAGHRFTSSRKSHPPVNRLAIPRWFPKEIRGTLIVPSCPNDLTLKSIQSLVKYRAWLGKKQHNAWQKYFVPAAERHKLTKYLMIKRKKNSEMLRTVLDYRNRQRAATKKNGFATIEKLDKITKGLRVLDDVIAVAYANERRLYHTQLNNSMPPSFVTPRRKPCLDCD